MIIILDPHYNMNRYKSLIILDWDDTLFPTSWINKNKIDLTNETQQQKHIVFFSKLDSILYDLFSKITKSATVIIVTNAVVRWILLSSVMIPNTQKLLRDHVTVLSARDIYQSKYPNDMHVWKKALFQNIVQEHFDKYPYQNIISIGDAEYEFIALTDLYHHQHVKNGRLLKSIRFVRDPSFKSILDQLNVLNNSIHNILSSGRHMDLQFTDKTK
jgi:hypothetical protein